MALNIVELPYSYFPDFNRGRPLFNADIYVGNVDTDPEIPANQKQVTVRQEDGTEVQIAQPVKTSAGGVPTYNGSPVTVLVDGSYSIKVLDRFGAEEYYSPDVTKGVPITPESLPTYTDLVFDSVAGVKSSTTQGGVAIDFSSVANDSKIEVNGYSTPGIGSTELIRDISEDNVGNASTDWNDNGLVNNKFLVYGPNGEAFRYPQGTVFDLHALGLVPGGEISGFVALVQSYAVAVDKRVIATFEYDCIGASTTTIDMGYMRLDGNGAAIDHTGNAGVAIFVTGTKTPPYRQDMNGLFNFEHFSDRAAGTVAIQYDGTMNSGVRCRTEGVISHDFEFGDDYQDHAYLVTHNERGIFNCDECVRQLAGITDAGENITYNNGVIYNSKILIRAENPAGNFKFIGTSLDYPDEKFAIVDQMLVTLTDCHVEGVNFEDQMWTVNGEGGAVMATGGWWLSTTSGINTNCNHYIQCGPGAAFYLTKARINNIRTATDALSVGAGDVKIRECTSFQIPELNSVLNATYSRMVDGSFEQASIIDDIYRSRDTTAITDRFGTSGVDNVALSVSTDTFKTGSQSLKCEKRFGSGSASEFSINIPCEVGDVVAGRLSVRHLASGAGSGNIPISFGYSNVRVNDSGVPNVPSFTTLGSDTFTAVANTDSGWVEFLLNKTPLNRCPHGATHFVIKFNLDAFNALGDSIYIDDANFDVIL